jgi:hypothetical protein
MLIDVAATIVFCFAFFLFEKNVAFCVVFSFVLHLTHPRTTHSMETEENHTDSSSIKKEQTPPERRWKIYFS